MTQRSADTLEELVGPEEAASIMNRMGGGSRGSFVMSNQDIINNMWKGMKLHPYRNAGLVAGAGAVGLYSTGE